MSAQIDGSMASRFRCDRRDPARREYCYYYLTNTPPSLLHGDKSSLSREALEHAPCRQLFKLPSAARLLVHYLAANRDRATGFD